MSGATVEIKPAGSEGAGGAIEVALEAGAAGAVAEIARDEIADQAALVEALSAEISAMRDELRYLRERSGYDDGPMLARLGELEARLAAMESDDSDDAVVADGVVADAVVAGAAGGAIVAESIEQTTAQPASATVEEPEKRSRKRKRHFL
jgi:hypothetical protein